MTAARAGTSGSTAPAGSSSAEHCFATPADRLLVQWSYVKARRGVDEVPGRTLSHRLPTLRVWLTHGVRSGRAPLARLWLKRGLPSSK